MASDLSRELRRAADAKPVPECPGAFDPCAWPHCQTWDCGCPAGRPGVPHAEARLLVRAADTLDARDREVERLRPEHTRMRAAISAAVANAEQGTPRSMVGAYRISVGALDALFESLPDAALTPAPEADDEEEPR